MFFKVKTNQTLLLVSVCVVGVLIIVLAIFGGPSLANTTHRSPRLHTIKWHFSENHIWYISRPLKPRSAIQTPLPYSASLTAWTVRVICKF